MEIRLYSSFVKKENSTSRPSGTPDVKNVRLKEETSVVAPTFLLSSYNSAHNYVYVPRWDRYYFVTDCTLNIDGLYELSCNCDRLASFKDSIGSYTCFIERCSNVGGIDTSIADSAISSSENVSDIESVPTTMWGVLTTPAVLCRTINASDGITTYVGSLNDFDELFNPSVSTGNITDLIEYYACNPSDFVLDIYRLPLSKSHLTTGASTLSSGWYTGGACDKLSVDFKEGSIDLAMPSRKYNDWREYSPTFTKYYVHIPSVGIVEVPNNIIDNGLNLEYYLDLLTGDVTFDLRRGGTYESIGKFSSNVKSSVQYGSMTPSLGGVVSGVGGVVVGASTGNPIAIGSSVVNAVQNIISPAPSVSMSISSFTDFEVSSSIHVIRQSKESSSSPSTLGKPCNKNLSIGSIPGYIQCAGASVSIPGFESDKEAINSFLNGGFYYE